MAGHQVLHGLGDGACDGQHAAGAQAHAKAAQLPVRVPDRDGATRAPVDLGACARSTGQREHGGGPPGSPRAHSGFDERGAAVTAALAQALETLGGRRGRALQPADQRWFERIACAGGLPGRAWPAVLVGQPVGPGAGSARQGRGELRRVEPLVRLEVFPLTKTGVIDHASPSQICLNTAWRSTGASSPGRGRVGRAAVGLSASRSRAKTWERGR
jgi:hypothetical protein